MGGAQPASQWPDRTPASSDAGRCLGWLRDTDEQFDLIFIDPPTFSNSKRMEDSFDVQRDHLRLMTDLKRLLRKGGTIMFSNNKRGFRMDHDGWPLWD